MFDIRKRVDLSYIGESWKECYLEFNPLSIKEVQDLPAKLEANTTEEASKAVDTTVKMLEDRFVDGFAIKNGERVQVKKEEIREFPAEVLVKILEVLNGEMDKKKLMQS